MITIDDNPYTNCENIDWRRHRILFNSFYHKVETEVKYEIPTVAKNLFINLAKIITKSLNVTNCYVCGGTNQSERWPPERIIAYYNPATWTEDESWGYRTPIYMLNKIIKLQAVVEIVVNKIGDALRLIAKQNTKMRTALYQNRLALDYLLTQKRWCL